MVCGSSCFKEAGSSAFQKLFSASSYKSFLVEFPESDRQHPVKYGLEQAASGESSSAAGRGPRGITRCLRVHVALTDSLLYVVSGVVYD